MLTLWYSMDLDIANRVTLHHTCHFHCDHQDHHISPASSRTTSVVNRLTLHCWFLLLAFVPAVLNKYTSCGSSFSIIFLSIWQARLSFWIPWCASKVVILFGWDRGMLPCEASVESRLDPEALSKSLLPWVWILDFSSLIPKKKLKTLKTVVSFFFQGRNFDVRFFFNTVKRENIIHKRVQWFLGTASDCGYDFAVGHNYHSVVIQCHMHIIHDVPQKKMRIQKAFATSGRTHT